MVIYFNPDCSKCNEAADLLRKNDCDFEIRNYLLNPPSVAELKELVEMLGCRPEDLVRKKEQLYQERFDGQMLSDEQWLRILSEHPVLLERPIVIDGKKAIVGRPPSLVLTLAKG